MDLVTLALVKKLAGSGGGSGAGTPGKDGREIEIQNNGTAIQWRYAGDDDWTDLVQLSDITGAKGDPGTTPTIGENGNWYLGETDTGKPSRGEKGNTGEGIPAGGSTGQMLVKKSNEDNDTEWKTPLTAAEVAEVVMENYLEIIDSINGEAVYTTDDLETDLDAVNGEVI